MPQIPVYESQISAGAVPKSPEATADDFGAQTSKAIVGLTQAGLDLTGTVIQARRAAESNRGMADATREIGAIAGPDADDGDPATRVDRVKQGLEALESKYRAMDDGAYRDGALGVFGSLAPTVLATERSKAAKREAALHQEDLTADTDYYIGQAASASNDLERQINVNFAKTAIARANAAGYISKEDALARLRVLPGRIEEQQAEALIARDPAAAERALGDAKRFRNLDEAQRALLRGQATLARQKASFAAVSAVEAGLADGGAGRADIAALYERGMIGEARRAALLKRADEAEQERAEKAEGVRRVDAVLHEGGRLDPRKPKDQAAVDAHFDAVVAPGNPDQATLVAYVERIGMVPEGLVKRLKGGLASDDPQQVVNAASLIGALGKADARLVEGLGAERVRYAKAVTAGVEGALSPERAVELTDKSHGRPGVSDDEGAHGADVEDGEADKSKTAKDAEAEDDSNAKRVSGDDTKVGNGSGAKDDSATAGSDAAGSTSETVGPEISPVSSTEDAGSSAPDREGLLNRAGRDVITGVKEAPDQAKGGVYDAVRETLETLDRLFRWKWSNRASLGKWLGLIDEDASDGPSGETPFQSAAKAIPEVAPADSVTGGVIRGIAQFLFSYFAGSKGAGAGLRVLGASRRVARLAKPLVGGAFADAIARDPAEQNLMNLIEEHTELKIPVLEYLVAHDDDSEAEARFKKALEGILVGPVSEAAIRPLIEGLGLAVKAIRAKRRALRESGLSDEEFRRAEREQLARAYDEVRTQPHGPINDPLVRIRPEGLDEILVERGPVFERDGSIIVRGERLRKLFDTKEGYGFVKIIWRHGEASGKAESVQVRRDDVIALPDVVRDFEPSRVEGSPKSDRFTREYRIERDGRTVVYVITRFTGTDGRDHVVSIHVQEPGRPGSEVALSRKRRGK
jgi:hypothetical protein